MIKKRLILYGIIGVILFTGCSKSEPIVEDTEWTNEVIYAEECGLNGLACCVDKDSECKYGLECCVNPFNNTETYCAENCSCGEIGEFCCNSEEKCIVGSVCKNSYCNVCGGKDQLCCVNDSCSQDLICHNGECKECGEKNSPCCENNTCNNAELLDINRTECQNGICVNCGAGGLIACKNEPVCSPKNLLNSNNCLFCGDETQPCCQIDENNELKCLSDLECDLGFCSKKEN